MLFPTLTLLILVSSADQLNMASAFRLFDELDITITEANTTWMSSATRAPDLYVQLSVVAKRPDGSFLGEEIVFATTDPAKMTSMLFIIKSFPYVRLEWMRYTFGTDNVIVFKLMDQSTGYEEDILLGEFHLDLNEVANSPTNKIDEQVVTMKNETLSITSSVGYKIYFLMHHLQENQPLPADVREDDYEAEISDSPLYHVHRVRHKDGSVEVLPPDGSFVFDLHLT